jgi:hypothetical protein
VSTLLMTQPGTHTRVGAGVAEYPVGEVRVAVPRVANSTVGHLVILAVCLQNCVSFRAYARANAYRQ